MDKPKIIIRAKTVEEFQQIENDLKVLPKSVLGQIVEAENGFSLTLHLDKYARGDEKIYIPNNCTQISDFGEYIGCYCDRWFFKIPTELRKKYTYIFVPFENVAPITPTKEQ